MATVDEASQIVSTFCRKLVPGASGSLCYMDETLRRELIRSQRGGKALSIVALDTDHFKRTHDTHGHDGGDAVLKRVAQVLLANVRVCEDGHRAIRAGCNPVSAPRRPVCGPRN